MTGDLLQLFFPVAAAEIAQAAQDEQNCAILSGKATASNVAAGVALGKAVAAVFKARVASDGMKTAKTGPPQAQPGQGLLQELHALGIRHRKAAGCW